MTQAIGEHATPSEFARTPVEHIAKQSGQPVAIVQVIYDRAMQSISKDAKISQFVGVIAARQVLMALRRQ